MINILAIIQARLDSSRLPGKVLLDIGGKPMLEWVVERTRQSNLVNEVVVATTDCPLDDEIEDYCITKKFPIMRGSVYDVLDRFYHTARYYQADIVVRITADCPFIDPELIDDAIRLMLRSSSTDSTKLEESDFPFDLVANRLPLPWGRSYPIGLDVEVFSNDVLKEAWLKAKQKFEREHVLPYIYQDASVDDLRVNKVRIPFARTVTPKGFHIALMHHFPDYGTYRWTVDTMEDLEMVRLIAGHFGSMDFDWYDLVELIHRRPEISQINAHIQHKTHLDVDQKSL